MDSLDRKILSILRNDGRCSSASIGRKLGVGESKVRRRLKRMLEDGKVKVLVVSSPAKTLTSPSFLIAMQAEPDTAEQVATKLSTVSRVHWVGVGVWNLFARVSLDSLPGLDQFIRNEIRPLPGVSRAQAFSNVIDSNQVKRDDPFAGDQTTKPCPLKPSSTNRTEKQEDRRP